MNVTAWTVSVVLAVTGLVGGLRRTMREPQPMPPTHSKACSDCAVMSVDLHAHTRFSDGFLSPIELVLAAKRQRLDAIAVTEHNMLFPARIARWFSGVIDGPIVLLGQEVTSSQYHLIAVGLTQRVTPRADLSAVLDDIHRQGGVAIAAHPTERYWPAFDAVRDDLDAAQVVHPAAFSDSSAFRYEDMVTFFERDGKALTAVGSSDFHFFNTLGVCRTEVLAADRTAEAILQALREGQTRVTAPDGRQFGRWHEGESSAPVNRPRYEALDAWDWTMRACGWWGVLGLLVLTRHRKE